eukprot:257340-Chlamydomonas_euryale.AAC.3
MSRGVVRSSGRAEAGAACIWGGGGCTCARRIVGVFALSPCKQRSRRARKRAASSRAQRV